MKKLHTPLYHMLKEHAHNNPVSFHVPGHRNGQVLDELLVEESDEGLSALQQLMKLDMTELNSTDDLHDPQGAIAEAQQLAARTFGADHTFFLVGGSTSGNLAIILSVCDRDDIVIVQRNVHKSIMNGLKLAGARAVFVSPQLDEFTDIATLPSVRSIQEALEQYPSAKAVIVTNPNYYGMGYKLEEWADAVHAYRIPLIVDEAHGAHYGIHPELPKSALSAGADAVIQSTHKTLPSLTMSAMLHIKGNLINKETVQQMLSIIESSSPSFLLLASLDISRAMIDQQGSLLFEHSIREASSLRKWAKEHLKNLHVIDFENIRSVASNKQKQYDPLRILVKDRTATMSGFAIQEALEKQNCWIEMSDAIHTVLLIHAHIDESSIERLKQACLTIDNSISVCNQSMDEEHVGRGNMKDIDEAHAESKLVSTISQPFTLKRLPTEENSLLIRLEEAEGYISAESIIPYPPGIPVVFEGETWTSAIVKQVKQLARTGARFQNATDPGMEMVRVYKRL